jgi:hypothetical protein
VVASVCNHVLSVADAWLQTAQPRHPSRTNRACSPFFIDRVGPSAVNRSGLNRPPTGVLSHGFPRAAWWHRLSACVLLVAQAFSLCSPGGTGFQPVSSWWHRLLACVLLVAQAFSLCPAAARGGTMAFQACAAGPVPPERKLDWVRYGQPGRRCLWHPGRSRFGCKMATGPKPVPPRVAPPHACKEPTVADDATGAAVRGEARHRLC